MRLLIVFPLLLLVTSQLHGKKAEEWKAGVAKVAITPTNSIWLTGFAGRTNVSQGKLHELYVKALALEDNKGGKAVLITSDLLGFPATVAESIAGSLEKQHGLSRDRVLFNSSHTHGAPALASPAHFIYGPQASSEQWQQIEEYTRDLERKIVDTVGHALKNLKPARLGYGEGKANFGVNRRKMTASGIQSFVPNSEGPIDRAVPVLRVTDKKGRALALVFGYAAHPTTITMGPHYYDFSADFPGFAQEFLEQEHPGALAMFVQGCGGDVMVHPRGTVELASEYGTQLSKAVGNILKGSMKPVRGPLKPVYAKVPVEFAPAPTREKLEEIAKTGDLYHRWHAREMLKKLEHEGGLPRTYPYPLQVWQFGEDLTMIAMAGEVVADYSLRLKKELGEKTLWVAGYSNDLCAYIPSRRVLEEGGYEGEGAMVYYMQPGRFAPSVEETIVTEVHRLVGKTRQDRRKFF